MAGFAPPPGPASAVRRLALTRTTPVLYERVYVWLFRDAPQMSTIGPCNVYAQVKHIWRAPQHLSRAPRVRGCLSNRHGAHTPGGVVSGKEVWSTFEVEFIKGEVDHQ